MKKLYSSVILLLLTFTTYAQAIWKQPFPIDTATKQVSYQGIIKVPNATAAALHAKAKAWHAVATEAATKIPLADDEAAGLFVGKRVALVDGKRFVYTMAVECKDGQYEYLLMQFELIIPATTTPTGIPGRVFVPIPRIMPLVEVARAPVNLNTAGETRPAIQKMLVKANLAFVELASDLQHAMARP